MWSHSCSVWNKLARSLYADLIILRQYSMFRIILQISKWKHFKTEINKQGLQKKSVFDLIATGRYHKHQTKFQNKICLWMPIKII